MNCAHPQLQAQVKVTANEGKFLLCVKPWCGVCGVDFEITDDVQRSIDNLQLLVEVKPAAELVMNVSKCSH